MDKFNLIDKLGQFGVPASQAREVAAKIQGEDLMDLVNTLTGPNGANPQKASAILGKYGVKLGSRESMDNYLNAKYESVRTGESLDETFGVMTRINEGFTYAVEVSEQTRDRVLDWLDENQVNYQATSPTNYRIECGDRDMAYRAGRALSGILGKQTVRDSVETEVSEMAKKKSASRREREAKEKMADMKPRNPVVAAVKVRSGAGAHDGGKDPRKQDKLGRGAKHKPRFDEEIELAIGQDVMVGEESGTVKIPRGPNGTVGVIMNGQLEMVSETEINLNEGVLGAMKPVNPLFRLRELAGLPHIDEDDFDGIEIPEVPQSDPEGPLGAGVVGDDAPADMDVPGMGADPVEEPMADMDGGMDAPMDAPVDAPMDMPADLPVDPMGDEGVPGELGADPVEPVVPGAAPMGVAPVMPTQSEAMGQIEDALNSIQAGLADIRLSEYKSLIQKLQDLTNQAQMMGRDYLGERFERRKK